jgi:pimeloyl-ACP methyl ester carboxylesterase
MKIRANDIEIRYELLGEGDCLVLIHGFTDNLNMWYNQTPEFQKHCQVLTYDVRGFGQTQKTGDYSMRLFADDLYELLEALGIESACVLGYSMGGRIGLEFALNHPEIVRGLIFANSGIGAQPNPEMVERRKLMLRMLEQGNNEVVSEMMAVASFSPGFRERNPVAFQSYKDVKLQNDLSSYLPIMQVLIGAIDAPIDLSRLKCPALIIAGDNDGFMELSVAESMKQSIPNAVLKVLPTGHAAAIETPEAFNQAVLDFMQGLP